jgi:hypothetical protein
MRNAKNREKTHQYPHGWSEERIRNVIAHYETQTEDEAVAEDEMMQQVDEWPTPFTVTTVWAIVKNGQIELLGPAELQEGARLLVTLLPDDEFTFWLHVSKPSLDKIWDNEEDDIYAELLTA